MLSGLLCSLSKDGTEIDEELSNLVLKGVGGCRISGVELIVEEETELLLGLIFGCEFESGGISTANLIGSLSSSSSKSSKSCEVEVFPLDGILWRSEDCEQVTE